MGPPRPRSSALFPEISSAQTARVEQAHQGPGLGIHAGRGRRRLVVVPQQV